MISGSGARLATDIRDELSAWTAIDWSRRTGYVARTTKGLVLQLRLGVQPDPANRPSELGYFAFMAEHGTSWLEKPRWGSASMVGAR